MTNGAIPFDQRPGALEATRTVGRISAIGTRTAQGWRIGLFDSAGVMASLSVADAMALSIELSALAETVHALVTRGEML